MYGTITPVTGIQNITAILGTGDNFVSWYDLTPEHPTLYNAFASALGTSGDGEAYKRQFNSIDLAAVWAVPPPTAEQIEATKDVQWNNNDIRSGKRFFAKQK